MHWNWRNSRSHFNKSSSQLNNCPTHIMPMHGNWCSRSHFNNTFSQLNNCPTHIVPMHGNWCSRSFSNNIMFQLNKCSTHTVTIHGNWCSRSSFNNTSSTYPNRILSHVEASINLILQINQMAQQVTRIIIITAYPQSQQTSPSWPTSNTLR